MLARRYLARLDGRAGLVTMRSLDSKHQPAISDRWRKKSAHYMYGFRPLSSEQQPTAGKGRSGGVF